MTLQFNEEIVNDEIISSNSFKSPNFIGFINPYGVPINLKDKLGYTGHGEAPSIQERFRVYYTLKIKESKLTSPLEEYIMTSEYQHSEKERQINYLKQLRESLNEELNYQKKESTFYNISEKQMELDIYDFFINCYSADTFFKGVGNVQTCKCEREFWATEYKNKNLYDVGDWDFNMEYQIYKDKILAETLKNVLIQYLGYHSVERVPRTITTASICTYKEFYKYIANDFTIFQIPKMIWDSKKRKYVELKLNEFFLPDSELRLRDEIQAIKKLVPINERTKYL